jgi:peptidoglycan lytic transglycosylase
MSSSFIASFITGGWPSCVGIGANAPRLLAVVVMAATLAACAQSSVVTDKSGSLASRRASPEPTRTASLFVPSRPASVVAKKPAPSAASDPEAGSQNASYGLASFYSYDPKTASGEKFDPNELTAAHRTLPFGTRLRVTNVATGRSVTVRVNDRGPFVAGRVVDVSRSAAESLGMVGQGVAKVKLDVVQ